MKKMDYQNVKGTQDYLPEDEVIRRQVRRTLEDVFILYGCSPLETPILNYRELLASKYGGGSEILEEMYTLSDRGERELALRYDLTIPFAKAVAMNPKLKKPFKRYEIGKVFRDGPIKTGRLREFTQCDVDIAGVDSQIAEAELMMMALVAFEKLNLRVEIQYNNRKILAGILNVFEVPADQINKVILILDKLEKVGRDAVLKELLDNGLTTKTIKQVEQFLVEADLRYIAEYAEDNNQLKEGLHELNELQGYLAYLGVDAQCVFNPFLARGLEIYTGTIYEIFLADRSISSSIGSGGRYDQAIGGFIGSGENISTVGISFGLDVIFTAIKQLLNEMTPTSKVQYYIVPLGKKKEAMLIAKALRDKGFPVELEMSGKKVGKALEKANKEQIPYVIIVGEDEVKGNKMKIKDMVTGKEKTEAFSFS
ncbi:histidine--tRNA ligase [Cytobacillus horneckiae]|uniref:histidine--tRNA ligase n=1 Tax=Cytobacillus horneckiae TaxID=549687 RepID=UPI0034CF6A49